MHRVAQLMNLACNRRLAFRKQSRNGSKPDGWNLLLKTAGERQGDRYLRMMLHLFYVLFPPACEVWNPWGFMNALDHLEWLRLGFLVFFWQLWSLDETALGQIIFLFDYKIWWVAALIQWDIQPHPALLQEGQWHPLIYTPCSARFSQLQLRFSKMHF